MRALTSLIVVVIVVLILLKTSAFTINPAEQAIVTQFGEIKRVIPDAGLHFKTPFIQEVHKLEKRLLPWDGDPENMVTKDKKSIFIDVWARWRIVDPLRFYQACRNVSRGQKIMDDYTSVHSTAADDAFVKETVSGSKDLKQAIYHLMERIRTD